MTTAYTQKGKRRYIYLECVKDRKSAERSCPLRQVPGGDFEKAVLQQLGAVFRTPSIIAKTYNAVRENEDAEKARLLEKRDKLLEKLDTLRRKMSQSSDAPHEELNAMREETASLKTELKKVKNYIKILSLDPVSQAEIGEAFNSIEALWEELFPAEKHRLAQLFIEKIVLFNDRMELEIKTNGVTSLVRELNAFQEERK
jgi:site-specific DNA recombinase